MNINWNTIDLVMFDMDGTLLDLSFDNLFWQQAVPEAWATLNQHAPEYAQEILKPIFKAQEGTLNWYSLPYWSEQLQLDLSTLKTQYQAHICLRPHALQLLQDLKQAGKQLWLVTNAHPIVLEIKMQKTGIAHLFDQLISSHDLGYAKEQALFWQQLSQQYPFEKTRSIFIDDSEPVLQAAQHYGIPHLYGIAQPDSKLPARQQLKFPAIDQLNELSKSLLCLPVEEAL
ncbi:GMP/IMP nucleotidase [Alkanindiges sp. WGS2144]|uniref:GMP/IMP nucleotidase n=1 Tax=Alkanindiges sp. WGS2144 TaxID=3366808 RepID=UPI00375373D3